MLMDILNKAGVDGATGVAMPYVQKWDTGIPRAKAGAGDISWLHSLPHAGAWVDIHAQVKKAVHAGYQPIVLYMQRNFIATVLSSLLRKSGGEWGDGIARYRKAFLHFAAHMNKLPSTEWYTVSYEELISEPRALPRLLDLLGLPIVEWEFYDGNAQYYTPEFATKPKE